MGILTMIKSTLHITYMLLINHFESEHHLC